MSKDPAFLFYSKDFLTGVADLTMEERGQYITLLCLQHQKGRLSEKTCRLSLGIGSVSEIQDVIAKFVQDDDDLWYSEWVESNRWKRQVGAAHWNWKGGITGENRAARNSTEYKAWRKRVFERDDYTCQSCGKRSVTLHAHHIELFSKSKRKRLVLKNGVTLCKDCHKLEHRGAVL